jgi:peptidoglycan/LPS O-acetylase OafA/YrhL
MADAITAAAESRSVERLHSLDLVRALALLLGIVFHAALAYFPRFGIWLANDPDTSWPIAWASFAAHSFRMATFYLLAGYFGHMMLQRKGTKKFMKDRGKRIALPLVIFWFPILILFALAAYLSFVMGATPEGVGGEPQSFTLETFPLTHLWFLYVLMIFYFATVLLHGLMHMIDRKGGLRAKLDGILAKLLSIPVLLPVLLSLPVAAMFLHHEGWAEWWGIPTPDTGLVPNAIALVSYGIAFGTGWLIHRLPDGLAPLRQQWGIYIAIAVVLTLGALYLAPIPDFTPQLEGNERTIFAFIYAGMVWFWTFGLIGMAMRYITAESRKVRYIADSSYWLYLIHLPLIVALQALATHWSAPAELKLLVVVGVSMVIMLASYHWLVRYTFIGTWLNGKRVRPS